MKRLLILLIALAACFAASAQVNEIRLVWEPAANADGYKVHVGTATGVYGSPSDVADTTQATIIVPANQAAFVVVSAYNAAGNGPNSVELTSWPRPEITGAFEPTCTPRGGGGVTCTGNVAGFNFAPDVQVAIPYTGVTVTSVTRAAPTSIDVVFDISATAQGGNAQVIVTNPWSTPVNSGNAGPAVDGGVDIVPVVLPAAVQGLIAE